MMFAMFPRFPLSERYTAVLPRQLLALHESPRRPDSGVRWSERHLQCVWFDERYRPAPLHTRQREAIRVIDPGRWNLEAGPDFLDTVLEVGTPPRRICGDTEIHVRPSDWDQHRHRNDPRYANVAFHVTYHPGNLDTLPPHCLQIAMRDALSAKTSFTFADIDVSAYPHAVIPATPRPCYSALSEHGPDEWIELLEAAGQHRIEQKTDRMAGRLLDRVPRRQLFFEEVLTALGYKKNRVPFRHLAQLLPYQSWSEDVSVQELYALMLGTAGLLPPETACDDPEANRFIRGLWDYWWRHGNTEVTLSRDDWVLTGSRPANHPQRRIAAAAALFGASPCLLDQIDHIPASDPEKWIRAVSIQISDLAHMDYWDKRLTLVSPATSRTTALVGKRRVAAIITNVVVPMRAAEGRDVAGILRVLPREHDSSHIRDTAARLLGRDANPAIYATGLRQQGLLQIYQDFCLNTRCDCSDCALAHHTPPQAAIQKASLDTCTAL